MLSPRTSTVATSSQKSWAFLDQYVGHEACANYVKAICVHVFKHEPAFFVVRVYMHYCCRDDYILYTPSVVLAGSGKGYVVGTKLHTKRLTICIEQPPYFGILMWSQSQRVQTSGHISLP